MNLFWKKLPSTEKLEQEFQKKKSIYRDLLETEASAELKEYKALKAVVESSEFQNKKAEVSKIDYKKTAQFEKESWFEKMKTRKDVQDYLSLKDSQELADYLAFKKTDDYVKVADKEARAEDKTLEKFYNFERSKPFVHYNELDGSDDIKRYFETEKKIASDEFQSYKTFCLDKNRWETTPEGAQEKRFNELEALENIKEFLSYSDLSDFDFYKNWELVFEDDFSEAALDETKWLTVPFWGHKQNIGAFSMVTESHAFADKALNLNSSELKLTVAPAETASKAWHPEKGFIPKKFSHQAAIINSGDLFLQEYGRVEAKLKMNAKMPVGVAFYLCSEDNKDQITIMKSVTPKRFKVGVQHQNKQHQKGTEVLIKGKKIYNHHIIAVEWSKNEISWYLNDYKVHTETTNIPHKPMYLAFSSFATEKTKAQSGSMEIDWVRAYSKVNAQ